MPALPALVSSAFAAARLAQEEWSRLPLRRRLAPLREVRALVARHAGELAALSADARAASRAETLAAEVAPLAEACRFLERNAGRILTSRRVGRWSRPLWLPGVQSEVHRTPWGTVLIIGPGNYPLLLPGVQLLQALIAGNAVVLKPGLGGTPVLVRLRELLVQAGIDSRLVAILPETVDAAQLALSARPDKVVFTGSAQVGAQILSQVAPDFVPATLELSGCDAMIVRADADLELVVKVLRFACHFNGGATCLAPRRVFVVSGKATELEGRLSEAFADGVCPVRLTEPVRRLVSEAVADGAHFIAGGWQGDESVRLPIVLGGVSSQARLLQTDIFAPVVAVVTVADDEEAVRRANDCPYALGASIFSENEVVARKLADRLAVGVVSLNDVIVPTADARLPFGGRKQSGYGSTRGAEGLREMTVPKVITRTRGRFRPALKPPQPGDETFFQTYLEMSHESSAAARFRALGRMVRPLWARETLNHKAK